jgi:CHASE2 domain-containing sensor protein
LPERIFRKPLRALAAVIFCACLAVVGEYLGDIGLLELDRIEDFVGADRRTIWLARQAPDQRSDIALVTIDEETLRDYPFVSPTPRKLLAALVDEIDSAAPKAIGLDIIVERRSLGDQDLIRAISGASHPVILGGLDDRYGSLSREQLDAQEAFIRASGASVGHLWLEHKTGAFNKDDGTVRYVAASNKGHPQRESFSYALARAAGYTHRPASGVIAWLLPPKDQSVPLFVQVSVRRHTPDQFANGSKLLSPAELDLLKGRIVLVGADMTDRDQHRTPLFVRDGRLSPGVIVHAQAIAQIIDGDRDIREMSATARLVLLFAMGLICLTASSFHEVHTYREWGVYAAAVLGFVLLLFFRIDIPVGPLVFVGLVGTSVVPFLGLLARKYAEALAWAGRWGMQGR